MKGILAYNQFVTDRRLDLTVLIVTYNRATQLSRSIDSILSQSYSDFALLIVDNASTDSTSKVVNEYSDERLFYYRHEENIGGISNINSSIEMTATKYAVIFHDDDVMENDLLLSEYNVIKNNKCQCVSSRALFLDASGKELKKKDRFGNENRMFTGTEYMEYVMSGGESAIFPTVMYDIEYLKSKSINLDSSAGPCADFYFLSEICLSGGFLCIVAEKHIYRVLHENQDSVKSGFWMNIQVLNYFVQDKRYMEAIRNNQDNVLDGYIKNTLHLLANYHEKKVGKDKLESVLNAVDLSIFDCSFKKRQLRILLFCSSKLLCATSLMLSLIRRLVRFIKKRNKNV